MKTLFFMIFGLFFGVAQAQEIKYVAPFLTDSPNYQVQVTNPATGRVITGSESIAGLTNSLENSRAIAAAGAVIADLEGQQNKIGANSLAAAGVDVPTLANGENYVGFGVGKWENQGAGALVYARGFGDSGVFKAAVTTNGGLSLSAGVKF